MIIESILTTQDPTGITNVAPMGVEWGEDEIVIKPFLDTTTFRNLADTGVGIINVTDDVMVFAQAALDSGQFATTPAVSVPGVVLEAACSWREVRVRSTDATPPRARIVTTVVHRGVRREFLGFNRARHAVIEATILATRTHLIAPDVLRAELERLQPLVDKTAGPRERDAMAYVKERVAAAL